MRILVTGASGFIGRRLVPALIARGHDVIAASRSAAPIAGAAGWRLDLDDASTIELLPRPIDVIVHLAALIDVRAENLARAREVNAAGTGRLVDYAASADVRLFVHGSTGGVYGSGDGPFDESSALAPVDLYGMTKAQAELEVIARDGPVSRVLLRYAFPYDFGTPNPINSIAQAVASGAVVRIRPDGGPRFNPIHVDDAVAMTVAACGLTTCVALNIAGAEITSFRDLAERIGGFIGRSPNLETVDPDALIPYYRRDAVCDGALARTLLGVEPQVGLDDGLASLARTLRAASESSSAAT